MDRRGRPTVVVVGGDIRIQRIRWPWEYDVVAVPKGHKNVSKIEEMVSSGRVDHIVLVTRWLGHAEYDALKTLKGRTRLHHWAYGLGRLAKTGLKELIKVDTSQIKSASIPAADSPPSQPQVIDVGQAAKNQFWRDTIGMIDERFISRTENEQDEIGDTVSEEKEIKLTKKEKSPSKGDVLAAFEMHPDRELRHRDVADILEIKSEQNRTALHRVMKSLLDARKIRVVGGKKGKKNDPQRYRLFVATLDEMRMTDTNIEEGPEIEAQHEYLVLIRGQIWGFHSSDEALGFLEERPEGKLYRSVKVRVRLEIEE